MGEASKRGTEEQRKAVAPPKKKKLSANERNAVLAQASMERVTQVLAPIFGVKDRHEP
ncbi:MAG: hypothetical protein Q7S87_01170 [Agitococcus sp.]|nr:hypothetical protein [Agitococcus sp.]